MQRLRVMTVLGTRPEIIRLSEVIKACDSHFEHLLVHTGQNWAYALNDIFFRDLSLREPDYRLNCAGASLGETIGGIIAQTYALIARERPDALLVLGDTNSGLAALSAKRLKVPVFHMEAGNRCFDENVPEEINRRLIDHLADINLPYTEHGRRYLLAEGLPGRRIFVTGSPMREVLRSHADAVAASNALTELGLEAGGYLLVSAHRDENIETEANFKSLMTAVNDMAEAYGLPVIYSAHPRSRGALERRGFRLHPLVRCCEPFGYLDYVHLQQNAFCVLSDSGTLCEESALLGFPAVLLRTSTERPEALDKGPAVIGGITSAGIRQAVTLARELYGRDTAPVPDYQDEHVADKVVRIIQSYTGIVNREVWGK